MRRNVNAPPQQSARRSTSPEEAEGGIPGSVSVSIIVWSWRNFYADDLCVEVPSLNHCDIPAVLILIVIMLYGHFRQVP